MFVDKFEAYLKSKSTATAEACLLYMLKKDIRLVSEQIDRYSIFFFVKNSTCAGVTVPKYLEREAQHFLEKSNIQGTVFGDASFVIIEYQDTGARAIVFKSSLTGRYLEYTKNGATVPITVVSDLCNVNKTAALLCLCGSIKDKVKEV